MLGTARLHARAGCSAVPCSRTSRPAPPVAGPARSPAAGPSLTAALRQFLDTGDSVYRGRIENRIPHRNGPPSPMGA
jgi:hypothetical protein